MSVSSVVRVLMYSHDTFGLGHLTRTLRVARALRQRTDRVSVLITSGSPVAPYMAFPPGADLVKLPSVVKVGRDRYRSRDLEIDFSRIKKMRDQVIRSTTLSFRPHLFLVDNVPLGMKKEVLPTLRLLRESLPETRTILILRDILDDPEVIREGWRQNGVPAVLRDLYDGIFVLGDAGLFDAGRAYDLPPEKTMHVGYAAPAGRRPAEDRPDRNGRARILFTAGGGGDGLEFLCAALEGLGGLVSPAGGSGIDLEVVTGPLMEPEGRRLLHEKAAACGAVLHEFVPDLPEKMKAADLVVAMAGYNTCCEILSFARAALLIPRITPRVEQLLRCRALESRGLVSVFHGNTGSPRDLRTAVMDALHHGPAIRPENLPRMDGLPALARTLEGLMPAPPARRERCPRPGQEPAKLDRGARAEAVCRRPVWFWPGGVALLLAWLLGHGAALAGKSATAWGGRITFGWDRNLLQSSFAEEKSFGTGSPDYWFEIDRLDDWRGAAGLWGEWEVPSLYKTIRVKAEYQRSQVAHNPILGLDEYGISLRQKLPGLSRLDFSFSYSPQVYLRHRVDKNAKPAEPRFRPEAYRSQEFELAYTRPVVGVPLTVYGVHEGRRETQWFRDRDRRLLGAGLVLTIQPARGLTCKPLYEFDRTRSRHSSETMTDYSHREHAVGMQVLAGPPLPGGPWQVDTAARLKLRTYTTADPQDATRYHRHDRSWWWNVYLKHPLGHVTPFAGYESSGRRIKLPSGADAANEEGEYDSSLVQAGLEWEY